MDKLYKAKQTIVIALVLIIIGMVILTIRSRKEAPITQNTETENKAAEVIETKTPIEMCYYKADKTSSAFYDRAWLKLELLGEKVTGEFQNLPAETDSKVGKFEGTVGPLDQKLMGRVANVWWDSRAEGMEVKEELKIQFGEGSATVGFGEMVDRGDGVYVYKDKDNLFYIKQMSQIDCEYLDEKLIVEKYLRDNISTIATDKAVLGGTWYVISTNINPPTKTGEVTYEDGHLQSKAEFTYSYNKETGEITFTKFDIKK